MEVYKTTNNYYYKKYINGRKKRISKKEYTKKLGGAKKGKRQNKSTFNFGINRDPLENKMIVYNGIPNYHYNDIKDIRIIYFELFSRKFIFIGEVHQRRNGSNFINYKNLLELPIKIAKEEEKCVDVFIEDKIYDKPVTNGGIVKYNATRTNQSLTRLKNHLYKNPKHSYYQLHMFDTRENIDHSIGLNLYNILIKIERKKNITQLIKSFFTKDSAELLNEFDEFNELKSSQKQKIEKYISLVVRRIKKEYNKMRRKIKNEYIKPAELVELLDHPVLFMTDLYLFYRLLMNFDTEKRNTGKCKNYSQRCVVIGGDHHIENVIGLSRYAFDHELKYYYKMPKINIEKYTELLYDYFYFHDENSESNESNDFNEYENNYSNNYSNNYLNNYSNNINNINNVNNVNTSTLPNDVRKIIEEMKKNKLL